MEHTKRDFAITHGLTMCVDWSLAYTTHRLSLINVFYDHAGMECSSSSIYSHISCLAAREFKFYQKNVWEFICYMK